MKKIIFGMITCLIIGSIAVAGILVYAFKIEPNRFITNEYELELTTGGEDSIRVVQFSDVHLGPNYSLEQLEKLVECINKLKPDIVVFTGDLMDVPYDYENKSKINEVLGKINSKYENYAVWGNHDHGGGGVRFYEDIMIASGFEVLRNESSIIDLENGDVLNVIGLDDAMLGSPDVQKAYSGIDEQGTNLLLLHQPDLVDDVGHENFDLALAGHSHGGQVVIPVFGPIVTPPLAKNYTKGLYELGNDNHLYVNSGIGTTRIPIRFWNPSEISVFDLSL